ncbi:MAG TPA: hypothetical protein VHX66_08195 [Solirubrobacteraceae bacterium]|jgi:hypothetical protein|nr:hypothetical protein [Solirubrobacteraceae bacterium]
MSEVQSDLHSEDIELDEAGADAVLGGIAVKNISEEQAVKEGYHAVACAENGTVMRNKKGAEIIVPYKNH